MGRVMEPKSMPMVVCDRAVPISKTARCIIDDAVDNGETRLYPRAKAFVDRMVADGLVTVVKRGGILIVRTVRKRRVRNAHR